MSLPKDVTAITLPPFVTTPSLVSEVPAWKGTLLIIFSNPVI